MSELIRRVAVMVEPGVSPFEFGLACEVFGLDRSDQGVPGFDFHVVTVEPGVVRTRMGFSLNIDEGLDAADSADVVVVCPVPRDSWGAADARVLATIRAAVERGAWVVGVCSGSARLAEAGVLDGRRAAMHWMYAADFAARHPRIEVDPDVLFVQEGRIITSAGTAAGIDACLHLLRLTIGAEHTNTVARRMVVPPVRDGGQAQFITQPLPASRSMSLAPVADWAVEHLGEELTVAHLAERAHMSPRTFARRFTADFGAPPAAWLSRQRVLRAQRMLEQTDAGLERIAEECGFGSAAVLRQNFARAVGISPAAYRRRFLQTAA